MTKCAKTDFWSSHFSMISCFYKILTIFVANPQKKLQFFMLLFWHFAIGRHTYIHTNNVTHQTSIYTLVFLRKWLKISKTTSLANILGSQNIVFMSQVSSSWIFVLSGCNTESVTFSVDSEKGRGAIEQQMKDDSLLFPNFRHLTIWSVNWSDLNAL